MKLKDVIKELQKYPEDIELYSYLADDYGSYEPVIEFTIEKLKWDRSKVLSKNCKNFKEVLVAYP